MEGDYAPDIDAALVGACFTSDTRSRLGSEGVHARRSLWVADGRARDYNFDLRQEVPVIGARHATMPSWRRAESSW